MDYSISGSPPNIAQATVPHSIVGGVAVPASETTPLVVSSSGVSLGGGVSWVDKTITSLSGSSQTLAAANAGRKGLLIKNGAVSVGINILGTTAAIGGAATLTLQPYEGLAFVGAETPLGAITVIGTAANYLSALEAS